MYMNLARSGRNFVRFPWAKMDCGGSVLRVRFGGFTWQHLAHYKARFESKENTKDSVDKNKWRSKTLYNAVPHPA
jgi:hypothetical protein